MENEAQCDDLDPRLEAKDPDEIRFRVILGGAQDSVHLCPLSKIARQQSLSDGHTYYPKATPPMHPADFSSMHYSH